ncbi:MAG: heavy-metal-associated domain-containing protein [Candidatus Rokubacteria bacterium]|nr:heavy-metal-associated domain-containing protein [Candidatus Rokubacteria bacterium]
MERVFKVPKIHCEGCAETITKALGAVAGVAATRVAIPEKEVRVEFDPAQVDEGRVRRALADAGFPAA